MHQSSLLKRLNESLLSLKTTQAETYKVLPSPPLFREAPKYVGYHDLDSLKIQSESPIEVPAFSLLRCTFEDPAFKEKKMRTEDLFSMLEERYAWLKTEDGLQYEVSLLQDFWPKIQSRSSTDHLMGHPTRYSLLQANNRGRHLVLDLCNH